MRIPSPSERRLTARGRAGISRPALLGLAGLAVVVIVVGLLLSRGVRTGDGGLAPGRQAEDEAVGPARRAGASSTWVPDARSAAAALRLMNQWQQAHPWCHVRADSSTRATESARPLQERDEMFRFERDGRAAWKLEKNLEEPRVRFVVEQRGARLTVWFPGTQCLVEVTEAERMQKLLSDPSALLADEWIEKLAAFGQARATPDGGELRLRLTPARLGLGSLVVEVEYVFEYEADGQLTRVVQTSGGVARDTRFTYLTFDGAEVRRQAPETPAEDRVIRGKTFSQALQEDMAKARSSTDI